MKFARERTPARGTTMRAVIRGVGASEAYDGSGANCRWQQSTASSRDQGVRMKHRTRQVALPFLMLAIGFRAVTALAPENRGDPYVLLPTVVAPSGGWVCGASGHSLVFTAGEPGAGRSSNASFTLWGGFEPPTPSLPCPPVGEVFEFQPGPPGVLQIVRVLPIPARASLEVVCRVPAASSSALEVIDPSGRVVRHLAGPIGPGEHVIRWNGRDDQGYRVPSGVYILRLKSGTRSATGKALVLH